MKSEDYNKVKERLQREFDLNKGKIDDLEYKIEVLKNNGISSPKTILSSIMALFSYVGVLSILMIVSGLVPFIANVTTEICLLLSSLTGLITAKKLEKKWKYKDKINEFSTAKKQIDRLDELIKYSLEKEKIVNKNEVLADVIDNLDINLKTSYVLENNHCWVKQEEVFSNDQLKKGVEVLENLTNDMSDNLDIKVTQNLLRTEFSNNNVNTEVRVFFAIAASVCSMFIYLLPSMLMNFNGGPIRFLLGLIVGTTGGFVFDKVLNKFVQDRLQVLKKYNQELGENAISEEVDFEKEKNNELELIPLRHYISNMMIQLEDMKTQLSEQKSETFTGDNKAPRQNIRQYEVENNVLTEEKGRQFTKKINNDNRH